MTDLEARQLVQHIGRTAPWCRAVVSSAPGHQRTVRITDLRNARILFVASRGEWAARGPSWDAG